MRAEPQRRGEYEGAAFDALDLAGADLRHAIFVDCTFSSCSLTGADLRDCRFVDCTFRGTDLASAVVAGATFRDVSFRECRITGVDWGTASWADHPLPGQVAFNECVLDLSSFLGASLSGATFDRCSARETDFSESDLSDAALTNTDLTGAVFRNTDLRGADLRTAGGYSMDVGVNRVHGMRVALPEAMTLVSGLGVEIDMSPDPDPYEPREAGNTPGIVFLCVHNAGRSQMAAGFARHLGGDRVTVFSGGSDPAAAVNPSAVTAMAEIGIDITGSAPQRWTDESVRTADVVVTMGCGDTCPVFPGVRYEDWDLDDPAGLGVDAVRPIRDEIRSRVEDLLSRLEADRVD